MSMMMIYGAFHVVFAFVLVYERKSKAVPAGVK